MISLKNRCILQVLYIFIITFCMSSMSVPLSHSASAPEFGAISLPAKYGRIIYNKEGEGNKRVYIIFQAHRSAITGMNHGTTVQAQSDIYRIEEWLVRNENVQLLLPEGFFRPKDKRYELSEVNSVSPVDNEISVYPMDDDALRRQLSDTSEFVNADKLLYQSSNIRLRQIEDRKLYFEVYRCLAGYGTGQWSGNKKIAYLQSKRNAHLLQKLPEIIEAEYETGRIDSRKAIFTIGMAHAPDLIRFVEKNEISAHLLGSENSGEMHKLNLAENGYQVTMIMPNTLIDVSHQLALNLSGDDLDHYAER